MFKKLIQSFILPVLLCSGMAAHAIDAGPLLPAEQAFLPTVAAGKQDIVVHFQIAVGY